jgi:hypothetical protein
VIRKFIGSAELAHVLAASLKMVGAVVVHHGVRGRRGRQLAQHERTRQPEIGEDQALPQGQSRADPLEEPTRRLREARAHLRRL